MKPVLIALAALCIGSASFGAGVVLDGLTEPSVASFDARDLHERMVAVADGSGRYDAQLLALRSYGHAYADSVLAVDTADERRANDALQTATACALHSMSFAHLQAEMVKFDQELKETDEGRRVYARHLVAMQRTEPGSIGTVHCI
jgi:hypothetical protein